MRTSRLIVYADNKNSTAVCVSDGSILNLLYSPTMLFVGKESLCRRHFQMKTSFVLWFKFHWRLFLMAQSIIGQHWFSNGLVRSWQQAISCTNDDQDPSRPMAPLDHNELTASPHVNRYHIYWQVFNVYNLYSNSEQSRFLCALRKKWFGKSEMP